MALSAEERIYVFTILGVPLSLPTDVDYDLEVRNLLPGLVPSPLFNYDPTYPYKYSDAARAALDQRLGELTDEEESRVQDLVDEWIAIENKVVHVKTDKVTLSYDEMRANIKSRLKIVIPITTGGSGGMNPRLSIG